MLKIPQNSLDELREIIKEEERRDISDEELQETAEAYIQFCDIASRTTTDEPWAMIRDVYLRIPKERFQRMNSWGKALEDIAKEINKKKDVK